MSKLLRISFILLLLPVWFMASMHGYHAKKQINKPQAENYHITESTFFGTQAIENNGLSTLSLKPAPPIFYEQAILHCFAVKTAIALHCAASTFHAIKPLLFAPVYIRICVLRIQDSSNFYPLHPYYSFCAHRHLTPYCLRFMKTDEQKRQERGNLILGIVCIALIAAGIIINFFLN